MLELRHSSGTVNMHFGVCKLSEDLSISAKCEQDSQVLNYSSFAGTKMSGYGI